MLDIDEKLEAKLRSAGDFDLALRRVAEGRAQVWRDAPCTLAIAEPVLDYHVWLGAGTIEGLRNLETRASLWAKQAGYGRMIMHGRVEGWSRALADRGFSLEKVLAKEL